MTDRGDGGESHAESRVHEAGFRLDQGDLGTCTVYATLLLVAAQLAFKYDKIIDLPGAIERLSERCDAYAGSNIELVVKHLMAQDANGRQFRVKVTGIDTTWVTLKIISEKKTDFDHLYALTAGALRQKAVILIKTDVKKHTMHAVVASDRYLDETGKKYVTAQNSWGGRQPTFNVDSETLYQCHYTMEVEIIEEYESCQKRILKGTQFDNGEHRTLRFDPTFTEQYRASQRETESRTKRKRDEQMRDDERVSVAEAASAKLRTTAAVAVASGATTRHVAKVSQVNIVLEAAEKHNREAQAALTPAQAALAQAQAALAQAQAALAQAQTTANTAAAAAKAAKSTAAVACTAAQDELVLQLSAIVTDQDILSTLQPVIQGLVHHKSDNVKFSEWEIDWKTAAGLEAAAAVAAAMASSSSLTTVDLDGENIYVHTSECLDTWDSYRAYTHTHTHTHTNTCTTIRIYLCMSIS